MDTIAEKYNLRKCEGCGKEFKAERKSAKFCSSTCRSKVNRSSPKTALPVIDVVKDDVLKHVPKVLPIEVIPAKKEISREKDLDIQCKVETCFLPKMPGHNDMCIYHWRKEEGMPTIPIEQYNELNG